MRVFGHRQRQPVAKAAYCPPVVCGVPNDYHIDFAAPFYTQQPYRGNPQVFAANVPIQPPKVVTVVAGRPNPRAWYGITPLSLLRR